MKLLKRVFKYSLHFKGLLIVSILLLSASIIVDLIPTQITQILLDDYVSGVDYPWVKVSEEIEGSVKIDGDYYAQPYHVEIDETLFMNDAIILDINHNFYLISNTDQVVSGSRSIVNDFLIEIKNDNQVVQYDAYKLSKQESIDIFGPYVNPVIRLLIILAILYISSAIINYFVNYTYAKAAISLATLLRYDMFDKMQRLPIQYFQNEADGRIVSKITNDTESVRGFFSTIISILVEGVFGFIIIYIYMYQLNRDFALFVLIIFPLIVLWMNMYRIYTNKYSSRIRQLNSQINAVINENIKGMRVIQAFSKEESILAEFDGINQEYFDYRRKQMILDVNVGHPIFGLFRRVTQILVILFFGYQSMYNGQIASYGMMYAFVTYLSKLLDPIDVILGSLEVLEDAMISSSRVFEFLDLPEETVDFKDRVLEFKGDVQFKNVSFKYTETGPYVLKNINFHALEKQTIAFVGHTGSGKTTTMSLLMRFFDYQEGSILIDGNELNSMSKQAFRRHVGMVLQDPVLFKGTIKSNIALNDDTVTDETVFNALKSIGAATILDKYKGGIHTEVGNLGDNLSTGERQLLSFARAMLYDPAILILDEATANIDTQTEQMIQHALDIASRDRTTFIVAHRLSTIKHANQIIVLDGGEIVEMGNHDELIATKGKYYQMYLSQSNVTEK